MCRAAATMALGRAVSKQDGAAWAADSEPAAARLIVDALRCRGSGGAEGLERESDRAQARLLLDALAVRIADLGGDSPS